MRIRISIETRDVSVFEGHVCGRRRGNRRRQTRAVGTLIGVEEDTRGVVTVVRGQKAPTGRAIGAAYSRAHRYGLRDRIFGRAQVLMSKAFISVAVPWTPSALVEGTIPFWVKPFGADVPSISGLGQARGRFCAGTADRPSSRPAHAISNTTDNSSSESGPAVLGGART